MRIKLISELTKGDLFIWGSDATRTNKLIGATMSLMNRLHQDQYARKTDFVMNRLHLDHELGHAVDPI